MTTKTPWHVREMIRLMWLVGVGPLACLCWWVLGTMSMHRLGKVLEKTGLNLQTYDW